MRFSRRSTPPEALRKREPSFSLVVSSTSMRSRTACAWRVGYGCAPHAAPFVCEEKRRVLHAIAVVCVFVDCLPTAAAALNSAETAPYRRRPRRRRAASGFVRAAWVIRPPATSQTDRVVLSGVVVLCAWRAAYAPCSCSSTGLSWCGLVCVLRV